MARFETLARLLLLGFLLSSSACESRGEAPLPGPARPAANIAWFHDLYEAHKISAATGRPMLVVFGASWCHYCKEMERTTLVDPQLAGYITANFVPVHLDADRDQQVAKILKVEPIPCSVVLSPRADLLAKVEGYKNVPVYRGELEKARQRYARLAKVR